MQPEISRFFMGTSSKTGFVGFPRDLIDVDPRAHAFLIKSGPGTGKSTLMRALAADFRAQGEPVEELYCSSDPDSLDGIVLPARHVCVLDATAPHALEPKTWGVKEEIVSLGDALNTSLLAKQAEDVACAAAQNAAAHARARRLLAGVSELHFDRTRLFENALCAPSVARIVARLAETELNPARAEKIDNPAENSAAPTPQTCVQRRFLSAVTPKGVLTFFDTPAALCARVIVLDDPGFAAASAVLDGLQAVAAARRLPAIACPHPLYPEHTAHLLFPTAGVAFVSAENGGAAFSPARTLHLKRCYDDALLSANKQRAAFDKKAERALLSAAVEALADAKSAHDLLEIPYKSAMNFKKIKAVKTALYQRISAFSPQP